MKKTVLTVLTACLFSVLAQAQIVPIVSYMPSGLLTGPVTYTSTLANNTPWQFGDGTSCAAGTCPLLVRYLPSGFGNLQASDGTSAHAANCYTWYYSQFIMNDQGFCQDSFYGGQLDIDTTNGHIVGGEVRVALYCNQTSANDVNGQYELNCVAGFNGTAIRIINGVDTPIQTQYSINVSIAHHPRVVWIPAAFRRPRHEETWQQIDSMVVTITPMGS